MWQARDKFSNNEALREIQHRYPNVDRPLVLELANLYRAIIMIAREETLLNEKQANIVRLRFMQACNRINEVKNIHRDGFLTALVAHNLLPLEFAKAALGRLAEADKHKTLVFDSKNYALMERVFHSGQTTRLCSERMNYAKPDPTKSKNTMLADFFLYAATWEISEIKTALMEQLFKGIDDTMDVFEGKRTE